MSHEKINVGRNLRLLASIIHRVNKRALRIAGSNSSARNSDTVMVSASAMETETEMEIDEPGMEMDESETPQSQSDQGNSTQLTVREKLSLLKGWQDKNLEMPYQEWINSWPSFYQKELSPEGSVEKVFISIKEFEEAVWSTKKWLFVPLALGSHDYVIHRATVINKVSTIVGLWWMQNKPIKPPPIFLLLTARPDPSCESFMKSPTEYCQNLRSDIAVPSFTVIRLYLILIARFELGDLAQDPKTAKRNKMAIESIKANMYAFLNQSLEKYETIARELPELECVISPLESSPETFASVIEYFRTHEEELFKVASVFEKMIEEPFLFEYIGCLESKLMFYMGIEEELRPLLDCEKRSVPWEFVTEDVKSVILKENLEAMRLKNRTYGRSRWGKHSFSLGSLARALGKSEMPLDRSRAFASFQTLIFFFDKGPQEVAATPISEESHQMDVSSETPTD